jgi:hypothetical protein
MKILKSTCILYTGFLLLLLLFPPWSERDRFDPTWLDPVFSSLGHHWRFSPPYHWGYIEPRPCEAQYSDVPQGAKVLDSDGRPARCGGVSVWEENEAATVDYRMLRYEAFLGLVVSVFFVLIVDWGRKCIPAAISRLKSLTIRAGRREFKGK